VADGTAVSVGAAVATGVAGGEVSVGGIDVGTTTGVGDAAGVGEGAGVGGAAVGGLVAAGSDVAAGDAGVDSQATSTASTATRLQRAKNGRAIRCPQPGVVKRAASESRYYRKVRAGVTPRRDGDALSAAGPAASSRPASIVARRGAPGPVPALDLTRATIFYIVNPRTTSEFEPWHRRNRAVPNPWLAPETRSRNCR
jgi:hypothetical protein